MANKEKLVKDIEESDDEEEEIIEPVNDPDNTLKYYESRQRELVTNVVDYNLSTLSDLITDNNINLNPTYQRRFRWDAKRQSKLIESFLMNVPVPPIFLNEDAYGRYSVIDGKQRLSAIHNFMRGRLTLQGLKFYQSINGKNFDTLPSPLKTILKTRVTLRAVIILRQSDKQIKYEVFDRLNTGGVHLNAQEIRNNIYTGAFNELILKLSENKKFHSLLGVKNKEKSTIWKKMHDAEFVLRYLTFRDNLEGFNSRMRRQMDEFMEKHQFAAPGTQEEMENDFLATLDVVEAGFGRHAFQRWDSDKGMWRKVVLSSLFDAQMFACRGLSADVVRPLQEEILEGQKQLFLNQEYRQTIDAATNTPTFFTKRIQMTREMIDRIIHQQG